VSVSLGAASFRDRYIKLQHPHNISLLAVIFGPCSTFNFYECRKLYSSWCFNTKTETKVLITWYSKLTKDSQKRKAVRGLNVVHVFVLNIQSFILEERTFISLSALQNANK
jgi:hypothetical protein